MKKTFIIVLFFLLCFYFNKVDAKEYITYSEWQEEYPYWLDNIFYESEDRYLWYREVLDEETNEIQREETTEYYKELDGYNKIEESKKTFYRYITNNYVLFNSDGEIVYNDKECIKSFCRLTYLPKKPEEENPEEIENPKTYDNIYVFMILSFLSFIIIFFTINNRKINLVMSNRFKRI